MPETAENQLQNLQKVLNYKFKDLNLLQTALTHRSKSSKNNKNNERLEFLGDSLLNFIVGSELFNRFLNAKEGSLTRMRAQLVKGETLVIIAKQLNIGDYLLLGLGEQQSGGHQRSSILEDALEAIIGALFLDAGIEPTKKIVLNWFEKQFSAANISEQKDAKTRLQELLQAKNMALPSYIIQKIEGEAHEQVFYIFCNTELLKEAVIGQGNSRRKAEQDAAQQVLNITGYNKT